MYLGEKKTWPRLLTFHNHDSAILEAMPQLDISLAPQNDARRSIVLALPMQIEVDVLPETLPMPSEVSGGTLV